MDFSFKKTFQSVLSSFAQKDESVVGIDVGTSSIKVVQLKRKNGRAVLETYRALSLGTYAKLDVGAITNLENPVLATALADVIRESGVTTKSGAIAVPASASLVFIIDLPRSIDDKNMATIIPTEARKYIPVPINEVLLDWFVVSGGKGAKASDGKIDVLLVAIHNDTIAKFRAIASDATLAVSFFEIEVFGSARAALDHGLAPVAVVDMGAATTKFYVVERGLIPRWIIRHPLTYTLSLGVYASAASTPVTANAPVPATNRRPMSKPALWPERA